jgi:phosphomannomutase
MTTDQAPLMLSVSGLRGIVGSSLTPAVATRYAAAIGQWIKEQSPDHALPLVVLGRDSRPSGAMFSDAIASGLVTAGCRVTQLGIVSTPSVAVMIDQLNAQGGVVVTASHNPIEWNGIKTISGQGSAPPADQAQRIIDLFKADTDTSSKQIDAGQQTDAIKTDHTTNDVHTGRILALIDQPAIAKRKFKVVLDSVNGAGGPATAQLLAPLGVELIHLNAESTGLFPHPPEPTAENLQSLCDAVKEHDADLGLAQDPDADRLAVVDDKGRYIGEEYTLALAALHMLANRSQEPNTQRVLVANLSTSRMINDVAAAHNATVERTPVGEANVVAVMRQTNAMLGGEGNGGIIWPTICYVRDSMVGAAFMLELLAQSDRKLSEIVDQLPSYAMIKHKVAIDGDTMEQLAPALAKHFHAQVIDTQDGIRVDWPDRWLHVRPSNTEPILRIIAEAPSQQDARDLINQVEQLL